MRRSLLGAAAALVLVTGAGAAPLPDYVRDNVGEWLVAGDDGKLGCRIILKGEPAAGGWGASPAADCASRLSVVAQSVAWTFDGGVRLLGTGGKVLLDFQEDETTLMKTGFEKKPVFYIVRAKPGVERAPFAPALAGAWALRRPGGPALCPLTLSKGPKDDEIELTLAVGTPCDAVIARLKLKSARVEDFTLMLYGERDASLRFEPSGPERYTKSESGRPLELVRAP